jgi:hypothetical protein
VHSLLWNLHFLRLCNRVRGLLRGVQELFWRKQHLLTRKTKEAYTHPIRYWLFTVL